MSTGSTSAYVGACRKDIPYPSVSQESVPSLIDNLVTALYGEITKTVVNRRVQWNIPCDPANIPATINGIPRNTGEGLLCYIIRALNLTGASGFVTVNGVQTISNKTLDATCSLLGNSTTSTTAINISGGSAGSLPYQTGVGLTAFLPQGTAGQVLSTNGSGSLGWITNSATSTSTNNINGGTAGMVVYQTGVNTTGFTTTGTNGQLLQSGATNSPTWIAPNNLLVTSTGSTTARTLESRFADVVNVKDFGAVGNGVKDDTEAIQTAINNGGEIFFPKGTYLVSGITIPSNTKLQGIGRGSVILFSQAATIGITISGVNGVDVFDLCFQDGAARTVDSILVYKSSNIIFFHCNWLQAGGQYISVHIKSCDKVILQDCTAFSNGDVGYACLVDGDTIRSSNITFDALNTYGYYNGVQVRWATVVHAVDCYFTNAGGAGFSVNPSNARSIYGLTINEIVSKVVFENTSFQSNSGAGFELVNNGTINNVALSNSCSLTNNGNSSSNSSGFYVSNSNASLISCSAQINNNWASGVMLERGSNISFTGALISNNARGGMGNGVDIISGVTYVTFNGCSISCQTGPPTSGQNYGINSTANVKFVIIANQFVGGSNWYNFPNGGTVQVAYNQ